jgi:hypothetical protein
VSQLLLVRLAPSALAPRFRWAPSDLAQVPATERVALRVCAWSDEAVYRSPEAAHLEEHLPVALLGELESRAEGLPNGFAAVGVLKQEGREHVSQPARLYGRELREVVRTWAVRWEDGL